MHELSLEREALAFERAYAKRSGLRVGQLYALDRRAVPCVCESPDCEGWQMISKETAESEVALGRIPAIWLERWS